jgi:hypothetical protein
VVITGVGCQRGDDWQLIQVITVVLPDSVHILFAN